MKKILFNNFLFIYSTKTKYFKFCHLKQLLILCIVGILLNACTSSVSLQITRPPIQRIEKVNFIEIGNFEIIEGEISLPDFVLSKSSYKGNKKLLNPMITNFVSKKLQPPQIIDLVRASIVHELSLHSQYKLINTTGKKSGFTGVLPSTDEVAILNGKIKFFDLKIESKENLSYFTNIKNRGATLEQSILATTISMGAESSGVGFSIPTPYVETLAALEVQFTLLKKSNGSNVIPPQTLQSYFVRKWGGSPQTSHLPKNIKTYFTNEFHQDEEISETILSKIDKAGLSFSDPTEYFARGFNLKQNVFVPETSLGIRIRLGRQVAKKYVKQISPYHEKIKLTIKDGNEVGVKLIRGNAFREAISFLQGLSELSPEDEYNLGLAFEAIGKISKARTQYISALGREPDEKIYKDAVNRTRN